MIKLKKAIFFNMKPRKALGPYGFPARFYQKLWDIVGKNVCDFVKCIWKQSNRIAEVNQTDIYLIANGEHRTTVMQFLPIFLCNTIYKVVSKVVMGRLKRHTNKLVSPFQTSFVPGRVIH